MKKKEKKEWFSEGKGKKPHYESKKIHEKEHSMKKKKNGKRGK